MILIRANQNSTSPKADTVIRFKHKRMIRVNKPGIHWGKPGNHSLM